MYMFVYGTLRPGQYNARRTGRQKVIKRDVVTPGRMRPVGLYGGFPVVDAINFDDDQSITGDIIEMEYESDQYRQIVNMEVGAGYVPVYRNIEGYSCLIWHYPDFDMRPEIPLIEDGDWLAWDARVH